MAKTIKALSFFTAMFLTFGITSLNFDNLSFDENIRGYVAIIIGVILLIGFIVLKIRGNQAN